MPAIDLDYSHTKMATIAPEMEPTAKLKRLAGGGETQQQQHRPTSHHNHLKHHQHPLKKRRHLLPDCTNPSSSSSSTSQESLPLETDDNDDLTNLNWLQDANLLQKFYINSLEEAEVKKAEKKEKPIEARPPVYPKPPYSYSALIFMAIESSHSKCMMVRDIYCWIVGHFPYFTTAPNGKHWAQDTSLNSQTREPNYFGPHFP